MAGKKLILFYETEQSQSIPPHHSWLSDYNKFSKLLIDYLKAHSVSATRYHSTVHCLTDLRTYLLKNNLPYTAENASDWCSSIEFKHPDGYAVTLLRLSDFYNYGEIQPLHAYPQAPPCAKLLRAPWDELLGNFLTSLDIVEKSRQRVKHHVARFLFWIQSKKVNSPSEITYEILESYFEQDIHSSEEEKSRYTFVIGDFITFLADKNLCRHAMGWFPYYWRRGRILRKEDLTRKQRATINAIKKESTGSFPLLESLEVSVSTFIESFSKEGYSETACEMASFTMHNLFLFLDMNGLSYSRNAAAIWIENEKRLRSGLEWTRLQRVLDLFDLYLSTEKLFPEIYFRKRERLYDSLPAWCKDNADRYLELKEKEGWKKSTIIGARSVIARFCIFLDNRGLSSLSAVTPEILKDYNTSDEHTSKTDRNTNNGIVRNFLKYLERNEILPYGRNQALFCTFASREKIISILSDEEKAALDQKLSESATTPIGYRDKAMLLIGAKMGLRASDVVTIRLTDIDWEKQTLKVIQEKTDNEILLPFPVSVGNAIYEYITYGRPNKMTSSEYLFVKLKMPYDAVKSAVCASALKRALPNRSVSGSGFHVLRKTFATDRLRRGTGKQEIIDLLGHQDMHSLHAYLKMDPEHMRMCPISLSESGLIMRGGHYD